MKSRYQTARKWLIFWTLFIGIGAMIDFGPLLADPRLFLCGAAAQAGIFLTVLLATVLGFDMKDAAAIGIIGAWAFISRW